MQPMWWGLVRQSIMRIAISGGSGLVGNALSKALLQRSQDSGKPLSLLRLVRESTSEKRAKDKPTKSRIWSGEVKWSPRRGIENPSDAEGLDAVIHLAGRSIGAAKWNASEKHLIRSSRVDATSLLASQLSELKNKPAVVISASAIGIYGNTGNQKIDEKAAADQKDFLGSVAADWESACDPLRDAGVRVVHPRLGIVLATEGGALAKMLPLFRWGAGGRLGSGQQYWSWVDLDDVLAALIWMLESPGASGAYNVVSPNPVTNAEFTAELGEYLNRPAVLPAPAFALRLALGEMADALLLSSCRAFPKKLTSEGFQFTNPLLTDSLKAQLG